MELMNSHSFGLFLNGDEAIMSCIWFFIAAHYGVIVFVINFLYRNDCSTNINHKRNDCSEKDQRLFRDDNTCPDAGKRHVMNDEE